MKDLMDYYSISGSCLFSIMVPENFLIGCYVKFFKENGIKSRYLNVVHICVLLLGGAGVFVCVTRETDPYIPFVLFVGLIVGIVQNMIKYRHIEDYQTGIPSVEIFLNRIKIFWGLWMIFVPYFSVFQKFILHSVSEEVKIFCYIIYLVWGMEDIFFNLYDIFLYKKKSKFGS